MPIRRWTNGVRKGLQRMSGADEAGMTARQQAMVDDLKARHLIQTEAVEMAFRAVPRHLFLPDVPPDRIYRDDAIVTHYNSRKQPISSSSQPAIMALMLEMLVLEPGHRVLEIGAGTGYNAALMAHIVGETGQVTTIDIDTDFVHEATKHLAASDYTQVRVLCGDGAYGADAFAPFDRIILTVGAGDIAPAWRDQLQMGGRLVLPLTLRSTPRVIAFERTSAHNLTSVDVTLGGFMPLRGANALDERLYALPGEEKGTFWSDGKVELDLDALAQALSSPVRDVPTGVQAKMISNWAGWAMWLELHDPAFGQVYVERPKGEERARLEQRCGLIEGRQVAVIIPRSDHVRKRRTNGVELLVRIYGESDALATRLTNHLLNWQAAGSPPLEEDLRVQVLPAEVRLKLPAGALYIRKHHMQYLIDILPLNPSNPLAQ
ncbi:MAG: methyltransferase domain-containing protein [Anaerolineae bacterium]|nr:methyltransferase domain-containing protein [Anaerolineae bacterium]